MKRKTKFNKETHQESQDKSLRHTNQPNMEDAERKKNVDKNGTVPLRVVTRGTSPTQPSSSSFIRTRRADSCKILEKEVPRIRKPTDTKDEEVQVGRNDDSRYSRFSSASKTSGAPWVSYLEKINSSNSSTGSSYSSKNYAASGVSTASRLGNHGYAKSNESPSSSRSDASVKTSSGSGRENHNSHSSEQNKVRTKVQKSNETSNSSISPIPKDSESTKQIKETRVSKGEELCQRRPSIPRLTPSPSKHEMKACISSSKSDTSSTKSYSQDERRGSILKSDSSASHEENQLFEGRGKELRKDFQQKSENSSCKSKSTSRSSLSKNLPRQMTRTDSSEGSVVNVPTGRSKSSSASSMTNHSAKIKATPPSTPSPGKYSSSTSVSSRQENSSDARGKPPVPKNEIGMKNTTAGMRYVNKDFRKSVLNMENGDPTRSQMERKCQKKNQRSMSISSQDSQSEPNSSGVSPSLKSSRSNLRIPSSTSRSGSRKHDLKESAARVDTRNLKSTSNSPTSKKHSNSGGTCELSSSDSSSSEEVNNGRRKRSSSRRRRRASESPFQEGKDHMSAGSSRTSVLASSADELSLAVDKTSRPPSSPRLKLDKNGKTEEAKSFLMRALAPVTSLFKTKQNESGEIKSGSWVNSSENSDSNKIPGHCSLSKSQSSKSLNNSEKNADKRKCSSRMRRESSSEKPWWMDPNSENVPEGVKKNSVGNDDNSQETTISTVLPDDGIVKFVLFAIEIIRTICDTIQKFMITCVRNYLIVYGNLEFYI